MDMRRIILCLLLLAAPTFSCAESESHQTLPASMVPIHYELAISPDSQSLTFKGTVKIALNATTSTREVVLNAKGLTLDRAAMDGVAAQSVNMDDKLGRATLGFVDPVGVGRHELAITYHGLILQGTFGFFAMDYDSPAGKRRTLATNFEPAGARMLLPCWDEPGLKATFSVTVDAPKDRVAVSNMPVAQVTPLDGQNQRVQFETTPKISTYLLFLSVGEYERVHRVVDGADLGVLVKRGDLPKAAYALDQAAALLHYYNEYFGVRYPLPKLDLVAAPGGITGGSMENWGAIFYSQDHLLFDPNTSTVGDRQEVFQVVSHEMAHQWFGDLVTMAWWDNLWLNEGFARWMQTHAADALHPEWRTGLQAQRIFENGKQADSKPSTHPILQPINSAEQAAQAFDQITYDKGASVITMLEAYVGPEIFRKGVSRYLLAHTYGNTIDSDLWSAMQAVSGKPILEVERDFTAQAGLPLIRVTQQGTKTEIHVSRFYEDPDTASPQAQSWHIPIVIAVPGRPPQDLLLDRSYELVDPAPVVNAGALSYARVSYAPSQVRSIAARIAGLPAADQFNLINDAWALGQSGYAPASDLLDYMSRLPPIADPIVWTRVIDLLLTIDQAQQPASPAREAFRKFALAVIAPVGLHVGSSAKTGEDPAITDARNWIWSTQARFGDANALERARALHASQKGSADERRTALAIIAHSADQATFAALLSQARSTTDPQERSHILDALAGVADPALAAQFVDVALGHDAPAGTAPELLYTASAENPDSVWHALSLHFDDPNLPIDEQMRAEVIPAIAGMSAQPDRIADLQQYADKHIPADARQQVVAAAASIRLNMRVRDRTIPQIDDWIAQHAPANSASITVPRAAQ
jgi:aminopeptidase N